MALLFSIPVTFAAFLATESFVLLASFAGGPDMLSATTLMIALVAATGCFPGLAMMETAGRNAKARLVSNIGWAAAMVLGLLLMLFSGSIAGLALQRIGVYSTVPQTFEVASPQDRASLALAGIAPISAGSPVVRAYVRFAFGDTRLLCATAYDLRAKRRHADGDDAAEAEAAAKRCVVMKRDELRPIALP